MMSFKVERFVKMLFEWGNHGHDQSKKLNSKCLICIGFPNISKIPSSNFWTYFLHHIFIPGLGM